jgi:hypothetical protein
MNEFWKDAMKQFGVGIVFAVMLLVYYNQENKKWEQYAATDQKRWETLLQKYSTDSKEAMSAIKACCMDYREIREMSQK